MAIVFADIAFAIDSIPAAFAITRDPFLIWMGNVFALLGLRALFVLVEGLIARFRYLDETIAIVLGIVGVKLLIEDLVKIGPVASLGIIAVCFTVGIVASLIADKNDPDAEPSARRAQRRLIRLSPPQESVTRLPTAISPSVSMSARRPPRCTRARSVPGSLSRSRCAQGSHSRRPAHATPPTVKRAPTSGFRRIPRVTTLRRASSGARPSSSSTSPSISVSARPPPGPGENVPRPSA